MENNTAQIEARVQKLESLTLRRGGGGGGGFDFAVINVVDTNANVTAVSTAVFMSGLTADRSAILPVAPTTGQEVVVKDADGSLAAHNIIVDGNGKLIDGFTTYTMSAFPLGAKGSVTLIYNGTSWGMA